MTDVAEGSEARRAEYQLSDRYALDEGRVFMTGSQALARLPIEQLRADRSAGWHTAAYISGYQGSPLAGYDRDAAAAARVASAQGLDMVVQPGLNEELAATAVMGSQLAVTIEGCRYEGITGYWYGKAPGLDRASDAIRHAVFAGTSARWGAVAIVGDDPSAKSSTLPSSSGANLVDLNIPLLYPGDVQEALDLGRHTVALSRACGLWTSLKVDAAVADGTATVDLHADRIRPVPAEFLVDGRPFVPYPSGRLLTPYTLELEREFQEVRLEVVRRYGIANRLNTIPVRTDSDWIGLVASGHAYMEVLEALRLLGLRSDEALRRYGIRMLKVAMPSPLDAGVVKEFAHGLAEIFVLEDKSPNLEWFVKDALYAERERPVVTGKRDPSGAALIPLTGTLEADNIVPHLRARLSTRLGTDVLAPAPPAPRAVIALTSDRTPYYCSGCPHNTSTRAPQGHLVGAGIGCHSMVMLMSDGPVGELVGLTSMGNEGAQWFGMAPFVDRPHLLQNIGDGTLFHSGMLAVRAAVANGVNITYKILYNGAVAMTGGQEPFGQLSVENLSKVLVAEGVREIIVTTEDVGRYRGVSLPEGVVVWDRERILEAQEKLSSVPGTTVLIHDQRCAAEKRRDRKRGVIETPAFRVVINERVCEGCGDCGEKSNCLSVQPVETFFGRKTRIDQTSCNFDYSCIKGDCPSFATVSTRGRSERSAKKATKIDNTFADPKAIVPTDECTIRLSGIGGTGVVTVSQLLGTAALMDGFEVRGLDQTGLSQKAGPVVSDVRLSRGTPIPSSKATSGSVDTFIAFDLLVAASDAHLAGASAERTVVIASSTQTPTGAMVAHPDRDYPSEATLETRVGARSRAQDNVYVDAAATCRELFGDTTTANVFLLGVALQAGAVPISAASLERAIELNGVAVERNVAAFRAGRRWQADPRPASGVRASDHGDLDSNRGLGLVERLATDLVSYQDNAYAARYRAFVAKVATAEEQVAPGSRVLTDFVARHLYKLMAYKDEYEVARLMLAQEAMDALEAVGGSRPIVRWHLHPPLLRSLGMKKKIELHRSARPAFRVLRAMKGVRGSWADPFGHAKVRKLERALIPEYEAAIEQVLAGLDADNVAAAAAIAALPDIVRGYEEIKVRRAAEYRSELTRAVAAYTAAATTPER